MKIRSHHMSRELWLATMQVRSRCDPRDWEVVWAEFRVSVAGKVEVVGI